MAKTTLAMIGLRVILFVALAIMGHGMIADAFHGHPTVWSYVVIAILLGLAAYVTFGLWRLYAKRRP